MFIFRNNYFVLNLFIFYDKYTFQCFASYLICRLSTPITIGSNDGIQIRNLRPTSKEITDNIKITSDVVKIQRFKEEVDEEPKRDSTRIQTRSAEATKPAPTNDRGAEKREELTALKALDVLLRKYDRRSTPTNDLGKCSSTFSDMYLKLLEEFIQTLDGYFYNKVTGRQKLKC